MFISDVYGKSPMYEVADRDNDKSLVYEVIDPGKLFRSRTYADYLEEFWNWLYTVNCDRYNIGDVAFLRGISFGTDPKKGYVGGPVLNVGGNALTISIEQGLFFCNTTTNVEAINEREQYSEALLRGQCIANLNQAVLPTEKQIIIDGEPIKLNKRNSIKDFRIITSQFVLNVPETGYDSSGAPYFDIVLPPGQYRCVAAGFCFIVVFHTAGPHTIYSIGKGKPWERGDYFSELLYEINVTETSISRIPRISEEPAGPNFLVTQEIYSELEKLKENKQIDGPKLKYLREKIAARENINNH
jgi:hypothetical protein